MISLCFLFTCRKYRWIPRVRYSTVMYNRFRGQNYFGFKDHAVRSWQYPPKYANNVIYKRTTFIVLIPTVRYCTVLLCTIRFEVKTISVMRTMRIGIENIHRNILFNSNRHVNESSEVGNGRTSYHPLLDIKWTKQCFPHFFESFLSSWEELSLVVHVPLGIPVERIVSLRD